MEIQRVYVKTRTEFGKQCLFDTSPTKIDVEILPNPSDMNEYILKDPCHTGIQHSKQFALHEAQTISKTTKDTGMFHFEGGWPKEINPRDEETTTRFRRRIEKSDNWAPKLRKLFELMEQNVRQNGAVNIYQHYFDDMIPTEMVQPLGLRTLNVFVDPETIKRPVTDISWSPDSGSRIIVSYCFLEYDKPQDYSKRVYIWQVDNPNKPYMALEPFCPCVVCEFNPRDPSVLVSGLMTGQVCNWDIRTGTKPVQSSHLQFSHRDYANGVRWVPSKSNTEFFSTSTDGRTMWWDTRQIRSPTETLMFDFEHPNEPDIDRAIGVSCLNYGPLIGTKFMFGMENGIVVTGSRKMKTNAEKLAVKFQAHSGSVKSVDRNVFNPSVFLTVGDWTARVWAEDTREGSLISTPYFLKDPTSACWNKARPCSFYVTTSTGRLLAWDLLQNLREPVVTLQLCKENLTHLAPCEESAIIAIGNTVGRVYLVEPADFFQSFEKRERAALSEYLERRSKVTKAVDARLREIKLTRKLMEVETESAKVKEKSKPRKRTATKTKDTKKKGKPDGESKDGKEKKKSVSKERKKRDDSPQLVEAEQRYFEMVQKGLEEYASETDPRLRPIPQQIQAKKQDKKQRVSEIASEVDKEEEKSGTRRKTKIEIQEKRKSRRLDAKKKASSSLMPSLGSSIRSIRDTTIGEKSLSKVALDKSERRRGKGRKPKISFTLPVPCKGEVCRPKVCCWRTRRIKGVGSRVGGRKESRESVEWTSTRPMKLTGKKARILREMMEPPTELTLEARKAKAEIREASLGRRPFEARVVQRPSRDRARVEQKRGRRSRKRDGKEKRDVRTRQIEGKERDESKKIVSQAEPCSSPKVRSIVEESSAILGVPLTKIAVEEKVDGKARLEELEYLRARVYPRISEYQGPVE